jgi:repressor LexA
LTTGSDPAERVLAAIVALTQDKGYPPTVREIGTAVGASSTSTVHSHLKTLLRQGRIRHDPSKPRTITVVQKVA